MLTPDKKTEEEKKEVEAKKNQPKDEKMFYDDWTESAPIEENISNSIKEEHEEPPKESNIITETFAKFGITEFLMNNKGKEEEILAEKRKNINRKTDCSWVCSKTSWLFIFDWCKCLISRWFLWINKSIIVVICYL